MKLCYIYPNMIHRNGLLQLPPEWLVAIAERRYGLTYTEALEMAYESVIQVAKDAMRRKRKPKTVK